MYKLLISSLTLFLSINSFAWNETYTTIGNTIYGADGSTYTRIGNTTYNSDGISYTQIGNTTYGSDGTSYTRIGNTTYSSDGTSYTKIGNTTYGSDGSTYTKIGNTTYASGYDTDGEYEDDDFEIITPSYNYKKNNYSPSNNTFGINKEKKKTTSWYESDSDSDLTSYESPILFPIKKDVTYRSSTDIFGNTTTRGSDGSTYRTSTDMF
ncbi:hypothetical protein, partial [Candidatus Avelusimicrobium stercoris]|uniref:hypothetical protein n=1 Tax=Candidatus Avelusimicrobium stercoris TaxID=1947924 RepID=UPI003D133B94